MTTPTRPTDADVVHGRALGMSLADFEAACCAWVDAEQGELSPDAAAINLLCEAVRLAREYADRRGPRSLASSLAAGQGETEPESRLDLSVVVMGEPSVVNVARSQTMRSVRDTALVATRHTGRPAADFDVRSADGRLVDLDHGAVWYFGTTIYIQPSAGFGGNGIAAGQGVGGGDAAVTVTVPCAVVDEARAALRAIGQPISTRFHNACVRLTHAILQTPQTAGVPDSAPVRDVAEPASRVAPSGAEIRGACRRCGGRRWVAWKDHRGKTDGDAARCPDCIGPVRCDADGCEDDAVQTCRVDGAKRYRCAHHAMARVATEACVACLGSGWEPHSDARVTCKSCRGTGRAPSGAEGGERG